MRLSLVTDRKIWITVVGLALVAAYLQVRVFQLDQQLKDAGRLREELASLAAESVQSIESAGQATLKSFRETVASDLASVAKTVSDEQARALEERLKRLNAEVSKLEAESRNAQAERDRVLNGLPEHVELDELNDYYAARWKQKTGYIGTVETFNTSQGSIGFQKNHFSFAYIPSSKRLAWLKIGKDAVTENAELIKAWLDESVRAKGRLGYVRQYRTTKPSDYGEYTEALYRKGDMYFKTYLQYQRVQGTYDRHSLQYTYYVETGSDARKQQYELEQYNQKLGS